MPVPERPKKIATSPLGRRVHRQHAAQRHQVVHQREDGFLDLTGILRTADQHYLAREVHQAERAGARPVAFRIGLEERRVEHRELRLEVIVRRRLADEEIL